ncbi:ubiquitin carboxyl-terminal hydrolase 31 isoform X2 [Engraulis encrasicolus]|uniref:ubiquitin carboxyl-terminal hydrolase 31 isoform X2 n=1 Tax=Engraulis encrasicolus TaxID=184585 RepID=UPI002FD6D7DA
MTLRGIMFSKVSSKDKKSGFSKKLFRRGSTRSVGSFMSRLLKTLTTLSHFGSELQPPEGEKDDGGFASYKTEDKGSIAWDYSDSGCFPGQDKVPGVSGLKNHGNTCFMNAILQCLSNTELFAEYLALEQYRGDESDGQVDKPKTNGVLMQRKSSQDRCEVTQQLSGLVRALWTFEYTPQHSRAFKNAVSRNAMQYRGSAQHDAQEFLLWLLDRVHEDLNNTAQPNSGPPIKPPVEEHDDTVEGPSPSLSTGSFVQELFQAQYRSSLTCPHCQKQSNTFDPFMCISLPIPLPHTRPLYVTVVYQGKYSHCMRIGVAVPLHSTVSRLRQAVSQETRISSDQFVLTEMYYDGFHRSFCDDEDDLDIIQESDSVFAFETPEAFRLENLQSKQGSLLANLNQSNLKHSGQDSSRSPSFMQGAGNNSSSSSASPSANTAATEKMILLICNRACTGHQGRRFGLPFVLYMERTVTWDVLQREILEKMRHLLRPGVYIQVGPFSLRVVGVVGITYLLPQEEQPLCHPTVERAYKSCGQGGPPHVKIVVEWDKETKDYLFGHTEEEYIPDAESVYLQRERHHHPQACTLAQCFQLYTREEQLGSDDAWRCPHCKQLQQGRIKLSLWTLPDVLILHLKRFRQEADRRVKMQNMVRFPLLGMDMAPHMVKRSQSSWSLPSHWSPWRRPYGHNPNDYLYDLYAVCNHHGNMHGGHYTAYCKNSIDGQWYCFDDTEVQPIADEDVCQQTAYILFYQRRTVIPSWSANSSVAGSTSSSLCDHWVNRLPGSRPPSLTSGASSRRTSLASLAESVEFPGDRSEDDGFSTRPFVRSIQRQSISSRSSVTSPLAFSENGMKPSWSLSAKLHMRSNSPSRFSLDSRSSPPLERIGEAASDDKVSTSCFGGYGRQDRHGNSKAPLATAESYGSDGGSGNKGDDGDYYRSAKVENLASGQLASEQSEKAKPVKEQNRKGGSGDKQKGESSGAKKSSYKIDFEKGSKKHHGSSASLKPSSQTSSSSLLKSAKVSNTKKDASKTAKAKSESSSTQKAAAQGTPCKVHPPSTPQTPVSRASSVKKGSSKSEKVSLTSKKKLAERTSSIDLAHLNSPPTEKPRAVGLERKPVRSISSSSSVSSLRSPSISTKDLNHSSKLEDKGLSFLKSALRQRESRRSADLGKTTLLSKKSSERTAKSKASQTKGGAADDEKSSSSPSLRKDVRNSVENTPNKMSTKQKASLKVSNPVKHSLLPVVKSVASTETMEQTLSGKKAS